MKKFKTFLLCLLMFALGVGAAAGVYYLTVGDVAWEKYLEEELIPTALIVISSVGTICLAALPVLKQIQAAGLHFTKATEDVSATVSNKKEYDKKLEEYGERLSAMETCMTEGMAELRTLLSSSATQLEAHLSNVEQIERIGFGNTRELVQNGYAREIAKVGVKDDEHLEDQG